MIWTKSLTFQGETSVNVMQEIYRMRPFETKPIVSPSWMLLPGMRFPLESGQFSTRSHVPVTGNF
jgi:hypothetical protein